MLLTFDGKTRACLQGQAARMCAYQLAMAYLGLQAIAKHSGDVFIPRGVDVPALDRSISYEFAPQKVKVRIICNACSSTTLGMGRVRQVRLKQPVTFSSE